MLWRSQSPCASCGGPSLLISGTDLNTLLQLLQGSVSIGTQQQCLCQLDFPLSFVGCRVSIGGLASP